MLAEWMLAPAPPACHLISASLADTAQNNPEGVLGQNVSNGYSFL